METTIVRGQKIAFLYRFGTGEEYPCEATVNNIGLSEAGYYIEGHCHTRPKPQKSYDLSKFWGAYILDDIRDMATNESWPVRVYLARALNVDPDHFSAITKFDQNRYLQLVANFSGGFAQGWRFAVGKWFRDTLDIRCAELANSLPSGVKGKKGRIAVDSESRWTQGPFYSFAEGHMLYDHPSAYTVSWKEALQCISACVQVLRGTPNGEGTNGIHEGRVDFTLSKPNAVRDKLQRVGHFSCTQNEFVAFLKTGNLHGQTLEQMLTQAD